MLDLVIYDKAGERILEGLLADAGQRLREEGIAGGISVFKSTAGPAGNSHGCQENYLAGRRGEFGRLVWLRDYADRVIAIFEGLHGARPWEKDGFSPVKK